MEVKTHNPLCYANATGLNLCENCFPNYGYKMYHYTGKKGEIYTRPLLRFDAMVVVLEGKVKLFVDDQSITLNAGQMTVVSMFSVISAEMLEDSKLYTNTFCFGGKHLCLSRKTQLVKKGEVCKTPYEAYAIDITPDIMLFIQSILNLLKRYSDCQTMYKVISHQMSMFLAADYSGEELSQLFKPVIRHDPDLFSGLNAGLESFNSVVDMEEWMSMDSEGFHERFLKSFGQDPDEWLQQTRASLLVQYIKTHNCGVKEILARFGFISDDHLESFLSYNNKPTIDELMMFQKRYMKNRT